LTVRWPAFPIFNFQWFFLFLAAGSFAVAFAGQPPSTDDQLRDSLNSKTDDDYDRQLLGDPVKPDDKGRVDDAMQKKLQKELGPAAQKEGAAKDPLVQVAEDMRDAQQRLDRRDSGAVTQSLQRQIVSDLDKLIEQAKKSGCCNGAVASGRKPTSDAKGKPGKAPGQPPQAAQKSDPNIRDSGKSRAGESADGRDRWIDWFKTELQKRTGAPMIESPSEYFLPEYKLEIEDYFRRLSEDQPEPGTR
jgi:hypothetical protein